MNDSFYLTLPSNVRGNNGNNTQSNFRTELPHTLDLSGEWEVALVEFTYPYSWNNVGLYNDGIETEVELYMGEVEDFISKGFQISSGQYDTIGELLENINGNYIKFATQMRIDEEKKE